MKIDGVIVVEGKSDVAFLSNFLEAEFVTTNGSDIPTTTIEYLKKVSKDKTIYVLTDPDYPGEKIRKTLDEHVPNLKHCFVNKDKSIKNGKVGVAESTKDEVINALKNAITTNTNSFGSLTIDDLLELGLTGSDDSSYKRMVLCERLRLGRCNTKTLLKRLNYCGITKEEIKEYL